MGQLEVRVLMIENHSGLHHDWFDLIGYLGIKYFSREHRQLYKLSNRAAKTSVGYFEFHPASIDLLLTEKQLQVEGQHMEKDGNFPKAMPLINEATSLLAVATENATSTLLF